MRLPSRGSPPGRPTPTSPPSATCCTAWSGALATTAAILLPGYLMLPLLWGYQRLRAVRMVPAFTRGLTVASVGLIFAAAFSIGRRTLTGWVSLVMFAAALAMAQLLKWNPLIILGVATLLGVGARALGWA